MTIRSYTFSLSANTQLLLLALLLAGFLIAAMPTSAHAQTVELSVAGGSNVNINNGDTITLEWYIAGDVSNCSISPGVGSIDTSSLPAVPVVGSVNVVPPENAQTVYSLTCDGFTSEVTSNLYPEINLTVDGGLVQEYDATDGGLNPRIRWDSEFTTSCDRLQYAPASDPTDIRNVSTADDYSGLGQPSGSYRGFDGYPHSRLTADTIFLITCQNANSGTEATQSVTLTITEPPPPAPVSVDLTADATVVTPDPLFGYAEVVLRGQSENASYCNYQAYYLDGTPYNIWGTYNWGAWGGHLSIDRTRQIATSTIFEYTCYRNEVTLGGVTYPREEASQQVTITLTSDPFEQDRTALPPVTVSLESIPPGTTQVTRDPLTGRYEFEFNISSRNAEYCDAQAYYDEARTQPNNYLGTTDWNKPGHRHMSGDGDYTRGTSRSTTTTTFRVWCERSFDVDNFPVGSPEYDNGFDEAWVTIEALDPPSLTDPVVTLGLGTEITAPNMFMNAVSNTNFREASYAGVESLRMSDEYAPASIVFPFEHNEFTDPSQPLNVYMRVCDENDGVSTFTVSGSAFGEIGTVVTDDADAATDVCGDSTMHVVPLATGVQLQDGEEIEIACTSAPNGSGITLEYCRVQSLLFTLDGDAVNIDLASTSPAVDIPLVWTSTDTLWCSDFDATIVGNGSVYTWAYVSDTSSLLTVNDVSTSTDFSLTCGRNFDTQTGTDTFTVTVTGSSTYLAAEAVVAAGECLDGGVMIETPPGYMAHPTSGECMMVPDPSTVDLDIEINGVMLAEDEDDGTVSILEGDAITLHWDSENAYECNSVSGEGFNVNDAVSGSDVVTEPGYGEGIIYTILCRGYGGNSSDAVEIHRPVQDVSLNVTPFSVVNIGDTVDLVWDVRGNDPAACSVFGPGINETLSTTSGVISGVLIEGESNFTLRCVENTFVSGNPVNPAIGVTTTVAVTGTGFEN